MHRGVSGGTGTLEEIAEVMSMVSLRQLDAPCILYNLNGYYDSLKALLNEMICKGLSSAQRQAGIHFAADLAQIRALLESDKTTEQESLCTGKPVQRLLQDFKQPV